VQAAALPGTVLTTVETHRLLSGLFAVEDYGKQTLKGLERPIQLYHVIRPSEVRGRLQAATVAGALTSFIGRDDELRLLMTRWELALEGEGHVVLISGEGGIGKSRLVQRFHQQIADRPFNWVEGAASPFFQHTPFYPVAGILQELLAQESNTPGRISEIMPVRRSQTRLSQASGSNGHSGNGAVSEREEQEGRLTPSLTQLELTPQLAVAMATLNLSTAPEHPASPQQHRRLLSTLAEWLIDTAHVMPLVIAIEDLHWADASTLELIQLLAERAATAPLMLLCTARPEFGTEWLPRADLTKIMLNALSIHDTRMMVQEVAARKPLAEDTVTAVVERAGGVPLFIEELTQALLESSESQFASRKIPTTLHDSLMARLDRLGSAKEVIQVGAAIGNEFSYQLIRAIHPVAEESLQSALRSLVDAQLLYVSGTESDAVYRFKHALIRDAAYEALLKSRRKELHRLVARTINERFPEIKQDHAEVLAHHWTEAGETEQAIAEWSRAGKLAKARGAFKEALDSYRQGLAMLQLLPESSGRDLRELAFRQNFLLTLWMTSGPSSHDTMEAVQRAVGLAENTGKLASLVLILVAGGWNSLLASPDVAATQALADQALEIALHEGGPASLLMAHSLQSVTCFFRGDLAGAENHFAATTEFADDPSIKQNYNRFGLFVVTAFYTAAINAWMLGRPDLARERLAKVIATTDANNPYQLAASRVWAADFLLALKEYEHAEACATQALELSEKNQFALLVAMSKRILGSARSGLDCATEGVELIRDGIANALEIGCAQRGFFNKTFLAAAQAGEGAIDDALETIEQVLKDNPDEAIFLPIILTLRGELRIKQGQSELAEVDFREALERARSMGAKILELQATMSLARLLDQQYRRDEARAMLAEVYGWFTEGFDTADLKDAKALLAQLRAKR
jgi:tetratricopeptide (TPR) repeat protein